MRSSEGGTTRRRPGVPGRRAEAAGHPDMISFLLNAANCGWPQGEYLAATLGAAANAAAGHCEVIPTLLEWLRDDTNNVRMRCLSERALGAMEAKPLDIQR